MTVISMNYLLEAGVHFGHQKRRWNPKMKEYIFTTRDDIYIIDLQKTVKKLEEAYEAMKEIAQNGGKVLFVGTKKQAQEAAEESAMRTNMFFVNERWLGGTLTNFRTIRSRIRRMEEIETMEKDGTFEALPKKEVIQIRKEYEKLTEIATDGGKVIFVGTKKQAQEASLECATRTNMFYVTERWLGGTLTNFRTIRSRVKRLEELEKMSTDGTYDLLPKKEVALSAACAAT